MSVSQDGKYLLRLAHLHNLSTIRGSLNKRGMRAARELLTWLKQGGHVGIIADGFQGPARIALAGAVMLASHTGSPVLPLVWSASSYIAFNSWDRVAIPKPFSNIDFYYGESFFVSSRLAAGDLETYRLDLEASLNNLYHHAWFQYGKESH